MFMAADFCHKQLLITKTAVAALVPKFWGLSQGDMARTERVAPFPQVDVIGAMVIVWRARGKIIRSVLCNIVCNNCAQCNAHTYEQT